MVASILKIAITRNTICDNFVGFPKSGHILYCGPILWCNIAPIQRNNTMTQWNTVLTIDKYR